MCLHPTPLTVYQNPETPETDITCYIGVSGCIGDVPFTAMVSGACGHTGIKGCKDCFLLGRTINDLGEPTRRTCFCSYCNDIEDAIAETATVDAQWVTLEGVCYTCNDGGEGFDETVANKLRITPELQSVLVQTAEDIRQEVLGERPLPPKPEDAHLGSSALEEWQKGALHGCDVLKDHGAAVDSMALACHILIWCQLRTCMHGLQRRWQCGTLVSRHWRSFAMLAARDLHLCNPSLGLGMCNFARVASTGAVSLITSR